MIDLAIKRINDTTYCLFALHACVNTHSNRVFMNSFV